MTKTKEKKKTPHKPNGAPQKAVTLADLTPDNRNANKGTERGSGFIEKSLRQYGAGRSILADKHGNILAGNKTAEAFGSIGMDKVRVIETDGTELVVVKRMDLDIDSKAARELAIADNRAGQISLEWDVPQLESLAEDFGIDLKDVGFGDGELEALGGLEKTEVVEDEIPSDVPTRCKAGELWKLGEHRLLCGDSTKAEDVKRLMDGKVAALCLTDPPYGIGEDYETHDDSTQNLATLIAGFFPLARGVAERVLLTPSNKNQRLYPAPDWTLCWFVSAGTGVNPWGFSCWQPVLAYGKDAFLAAGKGSRPDALAMTEAAENTLGHPCPKPVGVWAWFMERGSLDKGDIVYDPFLGSGTTLIAAEQLGRRCYGIEISAQYCSVIIARYEKFTGKQAEKLDG